MIYADTKKIFSIRVTDSSQEQKTSIETWHGVSFGCPKAITDYLAVTFTTE